jgi:hypothetical protein
MLNGRLRWLKSRLPFPVKRLGVLWLYRAHVARRPREAVRYLLFGREISNFTYEIANTDELVQFIGQSLAVSAYEANRFASELQQDVELQAELAQSLSAKDGHARRALFGRRVGWYIAVRSLKPKVAVETGVHDGLGSTVLLKALQRNSQEGALGVLFGFDIDDTAGWLIPAELRSRFHLSIGNSLELMETVLSNTEVGVFIHDSDHRYEHERAEYRCIENLLAARSVVISDNAHHCSALEDFSRERGRQFRFWRERTIGHFYRGGGIGLSVSSREATAMRSRV